MFKVTENILYVGVNDHVTDLFEGMYKVPNGVSYNSYVIKDEKIAVMDTVDKNFGKEWLENVEKALDGKAPDYLVVLHMEPDHSANILTLTEKYPQMKIVGNSKTFVLIQEYFGKDFSERRVEVKDSDELPLGKHTLKFVFAPMVHWPEVMFAYEPTEKVLFSADAFGKFGALDVEEDWVDEARRYYIGIVGKYGVQVQSVLKKAAALKIDVICPLHGPVLSENLEYYLDLYDKWSGYKAENDGIMLAYTSVYGNTKVAAEKLAKLIGASGKEVVIYDLARDDRALCVSEAFKYGTLVLATTTYNADIFPAMREFIDCLIERNYQNRRVAFIENGSWAPVAANKMKAKFEKSKNITFAENSVKIRSALNEQSMAELQELAKELTR